MVIEQTSILAAVMVTVEVVKQVVGEDIKRYLPLISLVLGVGINLFMQGVSPESVLTGILLGGAACGLYDFGKKTVLDR
mgnify:CR=1 FL=1